MYSIYDNIPGLLEVYDRMDAHEKNEIINHGSASGFMCMYYDTRNFYEAYRHECWMYLSHKADEECRSPLALLEEYARDEAGVRISEESDFIHNLVWFCIHNLILDLDDADAREALLIGEQEVGY